MKRCFTPWFLACLASGLSLHWAPWAAAAQPQAGAPVVIAQFHSSGLQHWNADTNGSAFKDIWNLPATAHLRADTVDKLAAALATYFEPKAGSSSPSCAALLRSLLDGSAAAECFGEVLEHAPTSLETTLAFRVDDTRSKAWLDHWDRLAAHWKLRNGQIECLATNSWVALHFPGEVSSRSLFARLQSGRPPESPAQGHWLSLEADLSRWADWFYGPKQRNLPRVSLAVTGRRDLLRSQARLSFSQPVVSHLDPWQIPGEIIRDPLISFTALRGIGGWLSKQPLVQELGLQSTPSEVFFWGLSQTMFQIQAAVPVSDAELAFRRISEKWVPKWNPVLAEYADGKIHSLTNRRELIWRGLPIIVPYLEPARDHGQGYLHAGIFPVQPPATNPPPPELLGQLTSQTNLVYYDWEVTQARLQQLRPILSVASAFLNLSSMSTNSSAYQWLDAIEPHLGNAVTEVTAASPRELNLVRTSHLGLNGLELLSLASWLDGTNFPHLNPEVGFRPIIKSHKAPVQPTNSGKPAPPGNVKTRSQH